jgi:hypothetical protein
MKDGKLTHAVIADLLNWAEVLWSWIKTPLTVVAILFAIVASCYVIKAAKETIRLRMAQRKQIEDDY